MRRWRRSRPRRHRRGGWIGKAVAIVALLGVIFLFLDWRLHPVVESMVTNQARITSVEAINGAVMEELTANSVSYTDLVDIERAESGQILAVTTDMNQMNQLKASILQRVQEQLGEHLDTGVPLGTLLGSELLHGRGPNIPVRLSFRHVTADLRVHLNQRGVNQTKHRICLRGACQHLFVFAACLQWHDRDYNRYPCGGNGDYWGSSSIDGEYSSINFPSIPLRV